jgi:hypothetical protein
MTPAQRRRQEQLRAIIAACCCRDTGCDRGPPPAGHDGVPPPPPVGPPPGAANCCWGLEGNCPPLLRVTAFVQCLGTTEFDVPLIRCGRDFFEYFVLLGPNQTGFCHWCSSPPATRFSWVNTPRILFSLVCDKGVLTYRFNWFSTDRAVGTFAFPPKRLRLLNCYPFLAHMAGVTTCGDPDPAADTLPTLCTPCVGGNFEIIVSE